MDRNDKHAPTDAVTEESVSWLLRIQEGLSQSDFRDWRNWLEANEAHAAAFDSVTAFWRDSDELEDLPWPDDRELLADDYGGELPLAMPEAPLSPTRPHAGRRAFLAIAATLAVALIGGFVYYEATRAEVTVYETATAEHRVIQLEDGSAITLGAESQVAVTYDWRSRNIELSRGEAYFSVAEDESRPFVVAAGNTTVRALGTEFNVNIGIRDIKISVIEGKVRVAGSAVSAQGSGRKQGDTTVSELETGDVLDFDNAGAIAIAHDVDPVLTTSWLNGRLAYVGATLETVIADVNRYSATELIIGDDATGELIFTGTIFSGDIDNWLQGLERAFPLRLVRVEGHGVLLIQSNGSH